MWWEKVEEAGAFGPGKRSEHTCNTIKGGRYIYVFGGVDRTIHCSVNRVDVFDTENSRWSRPLIDCNSIPPSPRVNHSCTTVKDNLFVFGGRTSNRYLNDLHVLDTSTTTHTWSQPLVSGQVPEAREDHSATLVDNYIFIFGGTARAIHTQKLYFNDLYMLNTETFKWTRVQVSGIPPSPRASHTCSLWNQKLIVICGEDSNVSHILSDFHVFDTNTRTWSELQTSGEVLTHRAEYVAVSLGQKLFVSGGITDNRLLCNNDLYMIDLVSRVWSKVDTWGESPSDRCSAAGACLDPYKNGVLVFMCGSNYAGDLDDMYYLHTGSLNDSEIDPNLALQSKGKQRRQNCQKHNSILLENDEKSFEAAIVTEKIPNTIDEKMIYGNGVLVSNTENYIEMSDPSFSTAEDSLLQTEKGTVDAEIQALTKYNFNSRLSYLKCKK